MLKSTWKKSNIWQQIDKIAHDEDLIVRTIYID